MNGGTYYHHCVLCSVRDIYQVGDTVSLHFVVGDSDLAAFNGERVHPFYSTFALGRDAEWTCRQFVLNMKEDDEEGIGSFLNIRHKSPALLGEQVTITAQIIVLEGNRIDCSFRVEINERLIAEGEQGQRILKKTKIDQLIQFIKPA